MNAHQEVVRSCDRSKRRIYTKKKESVPIIKEEKRGGIQIYIRTTEKEIYQTLKIISNGTSILYEEKGQKEEEDLRLSIS